MNEVDEWIARAAEIRARTRAAWDGGWYAWPHRHLHDGRLLALEELLDGWRLHVVRSPEAVGSDEVYDFPTVMLPDARGAALRALHLWGRVG